MSKVSAKKILLTGAASAVALSATAIIAGPSLKASYVDSSARVDTNTINTGTVRIGGASGDYVNSISGLLPGDSNAQSRFLNIRNSGTLPTGKLYLKITGSGNLVNTPVGSFAPIPTGVLNADGTQQTYTPKWDSPAEMKIEYCSQPWNGENCYGGHKVSQSYVSAGGTKIVEIFNNAQTGQAGIPDIPAGGYGYVKTTLRLPTTAGLEYQNKAATFTYSTTMVQRSGKIIP